MMHLGYVWMQLCMFKAGTVAEGNMAGLETCMEGLSLPADMAL
jgi:hypothetical protein